MTRRLVWAAAAVLAGAAAGAWGDSPAEAPGGTGERTANGVLRRGVAPGEWTHDWEAALAAAKEAGEGGAVFANFTGSDWCGWCKLMDRKVFSTEEWKAWAKGSGVQFAWVDFPEDVSLLPDGETAERNEELSEKYGVEGFPTYFLLDGEGTVMWQGGASREATPEGFIGELQPALEAMKRGLAWVDGEAGVEFPKALGGLRFTGRTDYGEEGLGYSLRYGTGGKGKEWADVYVYDGGEEDIGEGATPAAKEQVEATLRIVLRQMGNEAEVTLPKSGYVMKIGGVKYFAAAFQITAEADALDSLVAVTGRGRVFVKVRYSRPRGEGFMEAKGMTETAKGFLRDLGAVLGAGGVGRGGGDEIAGEPPAPPEMEEGRAGERLAVRVGGREVGLRWCPAGAFTMGSPAGEEGRFDDEQQHRVTLTEGFWMGETEVTQGLWREVTGENPSYFKNGDNYPVEQVTWEDCQKFVQTLNTRHPQEGLRWALPTEAQWEYACRAGTGTALPNGKDIRILGENNAPALDSIAWYGGNSSVDYRGSNGYDTSGWPDKQYPGGQAGTHPVGGKEANAWGLRDMIGNVWEWCADWYGPYPSGAVTDPPGPSTGSDRVFRGGSWGSGARLCRSAFRGGNVPGGRDGDLGLRVALLPVQ